MNKLHQQIQKSYTFRNISPSELGKVAVFYGGNAQEREISLLSGKTVVDTLKNLNVDVLPVDVHGSNWYEKVTKDVSRVFNVLHGPEGEDGIILGFLETKHIPYTGSNVLSSGIAMNKHISKLIFKGAGLPVAPYIIYSKGYSLPEELPFEYPVCIKPVNEGSSIDVVKVYNKQQLFDTLNAKSQYKSLMIEKWIEGEEYTVGILQDKALPAIKLCSPNEFYDYQAKYVDNTTEYSIPCGLNETDEAELLKLSIEAFHLLGCKSWGRVDIMRDKSGNFYLLEINTVPGFTQTSLVPKAAKSIGCDLNQLVMEILADTITQGCHA